MEGRKGRRKERNRDRKIDDDFLEALGRISQSEPKNISPVKGDNTLSGKVQNMDPLCGPGPWTGSIKIWTGSMDPLIIDRVHGPPIFTS